MHAAEEDNVQLISSKPISENAKAGIHRRGRDQAFYLSDSEIKYHAGNDGDGFEETTVFSDSLYGDSLPSMRAQLAATQMQEKKKGELESSRKSFLAVEENGGAGVTIPESTLVPNSQASDMHGKYNSLGGSIVTRRAKKKIRMERIWKYLNILKVASLTLLLAVSVILFAVNTEHEEESYYIAVSSEDSDLAHINYAVNVSKEWKFVTVKIEGPFIDTPFHNSSDCKDFVFVCGTYNISDYDISTMPCPDESNENFTNCHSFKLADGYDGTHAYENFTSFTKTLKATWTDPIKDNTLEMQLDDEGNDDNFTVKFMTRNNFETLFQVSILGEKLCSNGQVIIAAVILVWVYVLIGFDIVHRTMAAFIGSTCTLAVLSMINKRPTLEEVVEWIDLDTICLLFGMMTLVAIFSNTGFFDYSAVKAYKLARGKIWPLITLLCLFSAVVSAFLDNVTTILLLTPVSIRLCQVLNLDPRPVLIAEVVFSNIGGTATAIGDPPNVIIISNSLIKSVGIDFPEFTLHLFLGIVMAMLAAYGLLSLYYRFSFFNVNKDPPHISELKREVAIWERTAQRLNVVSLEERAVRDAILAKAMDVKNQLKQEANVTMHSSKDLWQKNLAELESKYRITDWILLIKSSAVLLVVIFMFFMSNILPKIELNLGWIAIFGGVVLLILTDIQDLESILHKIEWGTLLFFAGLFILMEGLEELGLIAFIGDTMVKVVKGVPPEHQMLVAIVLVLWVSAIASSFIDNIPFTTATIPVIWELANSPELCLSIRPLVWALALGACLGGNGTLIGASANVVCAGIAEQNGYKITFVSFLKVGFPMMLVTTFTAMVYLLLCHRVGSWNITEEMNTCINASSTL